MKNPISLSRLSTRVRASLLEWLGVPIELTDGAFWKEFYGGNTSSGQNVSERHVLRLSAVWACARLVSETIATLPLSMYERTPAGKRQAPGHPLHVVIHDMPNTDSTAAMFWEGIVASMLLRGNGRAEKLMIGDRTVGLVFLHPARLTPGRDARGERTYRYIEKNGTEREIPRSRVWTVPGFSTTGDEGLSVLRYGAEVFGTALAADTAAGKMFANGLMSGAHYKVDRILTPEQREAWRTAEAKITGAINAGRRPVLEMGMSLQNIGINPDEAQLLESRGFSVEEICRWFRVPPFMVGHGEKSTSWGTGIEQQMIGFLAFTLAPWLKRIEQAIWKDLLSPAERSRYYARYNVEGLLRSDSAARAQFYSVLVNNGIFTRDECRELEDRLPMGGNAAVLTVQSAMVPLDAIGSTPGDAEQARAALRAWLGDLVEHAKGDKAAA